MSSSQAGGFMAVRDRLESPLIGDRLFFVAVILMCYSQWLFPGADKESGAGSPLANILWLCVHLFAIGYAFTNSKLRHDLTHSLLPLSAFLALVCLSPLWSVEPLISARRAFELVGTTAVAFYFVRRLGFRGLVETLTIAIALAAVMSLTLILFFPAIGVSSEDFDNAWQGIYNHKNALGPPCSWAS